MPYKEYRSPGVDVITQRQDAQVTTTLTGFIPVFVGNGMTSKMREIELASVNADTANFPEVEFEWSTASNFNIQLFEDTDFVLTSLAVHKEIVAGTPITTLQEGVDYEVVSSAYLQAVEGKASTKIRILDTTKIQDTDIVYDAVITAQNTVDDYDLRLVTSDDRYYAREIFGPFQLEENGNQFFNDVAIAAEIAFRLGVSQFFYLEVPRNYGERATTEDFVSIIDKIYYRKDAYRIIPLTADSEVASAINGFTTSLSNPIDRREVVGFVSYDTTGISNMKSMDELLEKIGTFSESLNNERVLNVFGVESAEMIIDNNRYVLPSYFVSAAVGLYDSLIGMADPLTSHEINIFSKVNGPRFRPRQWDKLAKYGVFIVYQPEVNGPLVIRHQLTTKQSDEAEEQEYSIVKNFDAVTKRLRDRLAPYYGRKNITDGYMEKLDASLTSGIEEVKELGWARDILEITPWALRQIGTTSNGEILEENRNLVSRHQMIPMYPSNNLDLYLLI